MTSDEAEGVSFSDAIRLSAVEKMLQSTDAFVVLPPAIYDELMPLLRKRGWSDELLERVRRNEKLKTTK